MVEQVIKRIALAHLHLIESLVHNRARLSGDLGRIVRAVIRNHENVEQFGWIILLFQCLYQLANDTGFITRGNDRRVAVQLGVLLALPPLTNQTNYQICNLIGVCRREKHEQYKLQAFQKPKHVNPLSPLSLFQITQSVFSLYYHSTIRFLCNLFLHFFTFCSRFSTFSQKKLKFFLQFSSFFLVTHPR